jgi:hypothetical protein
LDWYEAFSLKKNQRERELVFKIIGLFIINEFLNIAELKILTIQRA